MSPRFRRSATTFFLLAVFLTTQAGVFVFPREAKAIPVGVVASVPDAIKFAFDKISEVIKKGLTVGFTQMLNRALVTFTANVAQKAAEGLAEGGTGGKPLFKTADLRDAMKNAADGAAGDFIDQLGKGLIGQSVCSPPELRLGLTLNMLEAIAPPKPSCSFKDMQKKWGALTEKGGLLNQADLSKFLTVGLNPQQTEIGQALDAIINFEEARRKAEEAEARKHAPSEFDRVVNPISKTTKTPSELIEEYAKKAQVDIPQEGNKSILEPTGDIWTDWAKVGAGVFITTFTQKYFTRLLQGLFNVQEKQRDITLPGGGTATAGGDFRASSGVSTVALSTVGGEYDVLSEFTTCPEDPKARSIYNCVIDQSFAQAVRSEMSIYDAMYPDPSQKKDPLLRPSWPFGYWGTNADQEPEYNQGYSYSNMKKLRRMRIIPVGWELAAELVKELASTSPIRTLKDVADCFNKNTGACAPFYKLVDPDWILKAPIYNCRLKAPGQLIQAGTDSRQEYCVDVQDCVVTNDDGNGCQAWGYCTQERNVWRFPGRSCPAQYNTCQQFSRESDGKVVSYLRNTLNFCSANAAGCTRYSNLQINNTWRNDPSPTVGATAGERTLRFLNRNAGTCTPESVGCTKFLTVSAQAAYDPVTRKPVDVTLSAYNSVQAAKNDSDANKKKYSAYGIENPPIYLKGTRTNCAGGVGESPEVNVDCELYTPTDDDDPEVPAIVKPENRCDRACVGYDAYTELATSSSVERSVYLIPQPPARACNAESVGCEEFTNLDEVARKGEAREYFTFLRQCQKPALDSKMYFTWVGTETTGFQLQSHSLKSAQSNGAGAPCTNRRLSDDACIDPADAQNPGVCDPNDLQANPDCREFYDEQGTVYYRLYSKTILSDEKCVRYRKTINTTDSNVVTSCEGSGGLWDAAKSECTYLAFPPENRTCSASTVGCREYRGPRGNDIRIVLNETFEGDSRPFNWSSGDPSTDSTRATGHSLSVTNGTILTLKKGDVDRLRTYRIDFWAKGSGSLHVTFDLDQTRNHYEQDVILDAGWKQYTVGPIPIMDAQARDAVATIAFSASSFFLDNVRIKEMRENFYLIKDSWRTDPACGTTTVPIQAGCRAYTDRADEPQYFKSVSRICEKKFVGCALMINTQNSASPYAKTFNDNVGDPEDNVTIPADTKAYVVDDPAQYCTAEQQGCTALGDPRSIAPFATFPVRRCKSADPNFNNKGCDVTPGVTEAACKASKGICEDTTTKYLLDNPDRYDKDLCIAPDIGCDIYKAAGGRTEAFRDPGDNTCDWRRVPGTSSFRFGWFKKTTPENATEPDCYATGYGPDSPPKLDGSDSPLATGGARYVRTCTPENNRCTAFLDPQDHTASSYPIGRPYFAIDDGSLDSARRDTNKTASIKKGYALFLNTNMLSGGQIQRMYNSTTTYEKSDAEILAGRDDAVRTESCGKVCLVGDSGRLGQACEAASDCGATGQCGYKTKNIRVNTATGTTTIAVPVCDANDLLRVKHDRTCAEWLACKGSVQVYDRKSQTTRDVCYQIGSCTNPSSTNATECGAWNDQDRGTSSLLTRDTYKDRDTTFSGREYAGYSIPYRYPVTGFEQLSYRTDTKTGQPIDFRLSNLAVMRDANGNRTCDPAKTGTESDCGAGADTKCIVSGGRVGQLKQGICYQDKGIGTLPDQQTSLGAIEKDCRAYPRSDSPFPSNVAISWHDEDGKGALCTGSKTAENNGKICDEPLGRGITTSACEADGGTCINDATKRPNEKKEGFQQANVAQPFTNKGDKAAQCSYKRVSYMDGTTLFFDLEQSDNSITSITYQTTETQKDTFKLRSLSREYGLQGYCLEEDTRTGLDGENTKHPCFTWFPTDLVQGEVDINNTFPEAGYIADPDRRFYCVEAGKYFVNRPARSADQTRCTSRSYGDEMATLDDISVSNQGGLVSPYYNLDRYGSGKKTCDYKTSNHYWLVAKSPGWQIADNYVTLSGGDGLNFEEEHYPVCTKLALIADPKSGESLGWTEMLKGPTSLGPRRDYAVTITTSPDKKYKIGQPALPYGAVDAGVVDLQANLLFAVCSTKNQDDPLNNTSCVAPADRAKCLENGRGICGPLLVQSRLPNAGSPYTNGNEPYTAATDRLKTVFARGFGIWEWQGNVTSCVKYCQGGAYSTNEKQCTQLNSSADCPATAGSCVDDVTATGEKVCQGGPRDGADCTNDTSLCNGAGTCKYLGGVDTCDIGSAAYNSIETTLAPKYAWDFTGPNAKSCVGGTSPGKACSDASVCGADGTCVAHAAGPEVRAAKYESATKSYSLGNVGVTVDTASSGNVLSRGSARSIALKFYAYNNNGQQMPLKRVMIYWGDDTPIFASPTGSMKNHKNECRRYCSYSVTSDGLPSLIDQTTDSVPVNHAKAGTPIKCKDATKATACVLKATSSELPKCYTSETATTVVSGDTEGVCSRAPLTCSADADCKLSRYCDNKREGASGECRAKPEQCTKNDDCTSGTCRVENFGDSTDACVQDEVGGAPGYFIYTHAYQCKNPATLPACDATTSTTPCRETVEGLPSCVFVPKVQVLDNWGWCNGSCEPNNRGCYNDVTKQPSNPANADCEPTGTNYSKAWTPFTGRVILQQQP